MGRNTRVAFIAGFSAALVAALVGAAIIFLM